MSLYLLENEKIDKGVIRIISEECDLCISLIDHANRSSRHMVIHELRKSFKKIRAAYRLVRDAIPFYHKENHFFRDQGRRLSDLRDASAMIEMLDKIISIQDNHIYGKTFKKVRKSLLARRTDLEKPAFSKPSVLKNMKNDLNNHCSTLFKLPFGTIRAKELTPSIQRVYRRGRKANLSIEKDINHDNPALFHEWRKRVKYIRYQLLILQRFWPSQLTTTENEFHKLSDHLGDLHDLFLFRELVKKNQTEFFDAAEKDLLLGIIQSHIMKNKEAALSLGERLYILPPKLYAMRIHDLLEARDILSIEPMNKET